MALLTGTGEAAGSKEAVVILGEVSSGEQAGINWVQVVAAALAAMSSAVLLSTIGVAGTIIGAAAGSVIASVGGAFYSRGIAASKQQVAAQAAALRRAARARQTGPEGTAVIPTVLGDPDPDLPGADGAAETQAEGVAGGAGVADDVDEDPPDTGQDGDALFHAEAGKPLPWKRIALVAAALFVVVMVAITAFELGAGRSVSQMTGGTTDGGGTTVFGEKKHPTPTPTPTTPTESGTGTPTSTPTSQTPSPSSSPTPSASPTGSPTEMPTPTPSTSLPVAPGSTAQSSPGTNG